MKHIWDYIKANGLQDKDNKKNIICDDEMKKVFGVPNMGMFEMSKRISPHLTKKQVPVMPVVAPQ